MKLSKYLLIIIFISFVSANAQPLKYSKVKVYTETINEFEKLVNSGIDIHCQLDIKNLKKPEIYVSSEELKILKEAGLRYEILIDDWNDYYNSSSKMTPAEVKFQYEKYGIKGGFGYGSMGGFYVINEIVSKLDSMKLLYPNLISAKQSIGTSIENKNIWMVKISDNPEIEELEPQVLYTALIHAREPQGMMAVLYYMYYLLENYGTDPEVTYLVNNREIYFIPCVNPDGYDYNRSTNPTGGGMWRKNRRNNGGSYGVDLNRNFGPENYWNAPNGGSSTSPSSDTYRGTAPFSEPEIAAIRNFVQSKVFKAALNYHTYSNLLIYPYGALSKETPDSAIFREFARDMTAFNGYTYGTDLQTVGYSTRGNSDDYMYDGDPITTRPKIFAMTPEVGSTGFWPTSAEIFPLAIENLRPNLYYTWIAGVYPRISEKKIISQNEYINPGETIRFVAKIKNKGLLPGIDINISFTSLSGFLTLDSNQVINIPTLESRQEISTQNKPLVITTSAATPVGSVQKILMKTSIQGSEVLNDTISILVGVPTVVASDNFESGTSGWTLGSPAWGLTSVNPHSPTYSITDSPSGNYTSNVNTSLTKVQTFSLVDVSSAYLEFWTKWDIESSYDFGQVQISSNGGSTWNSLSGLYTKPASGNGRQAPPYIPAAKSPGYDGTQTTWVKETMNLQQFIGKSNLILRFNFLTDGADNKDGWYIDDIKILTFPVSTTITSSFNTNAGWNIVSLPLIVTNGKKNTIFPNATSNAFSYDNGYVMQDSLITGKGYWLKFDAGIGHNVSGQLLNPMLLSVKEGWNIIGSTNSDIPVSTIISNPPGIIQSSFYEYNEGYNQVTTLSKGKGYWVKCSAPGTITLNINLAKPVDKNILIQYDDKLIFRDAIGNKSILYLRKDLKTKTEIPPLPPQGIFDVRYTDNTNIGDPAERLSIELNNAVYPVEVYVENQSPNKYLIKDVINGQLINEFLTFGNKIILSDSRLQKLNLELSSLSVEYELSQNYPNPFNPVTKITYSIKDPVKVTLKVYDILGKEVKTLVDEFQNAGNYSVEFDGSNLADGIYFYQINAGGFSNIKKMVLLK